MSEDSFNDLIVRVRARDPEAEAELFDRYVHRLIGLARKELRCLPPHKVDPESVANSVLGSFFIRFREGQFEFTNRESFWGLLALITLRKCGHRIDYWFGKIRDFRREEFSVSSPSPSAELGPTWEPLAREPTPLESAIARETVEQLMLKLNADERPILELLLKGCTPLEISRQVGRTEYKVRQVQELVQTLLIELLKDH